MAVLEKLKELSADERMRQLAEDRQRALLDWAIERQATKAEGKAEGIAKGRAEGELHAKKLLPARY